MKTVLVFGVAVVDFVFQMRELPGAAIKYRADDAAIVGGGCAANAAVAIARLGGSAHLVARMGQDVLGDLIVSQLEEDGVDCSKVKRISGKKSSFSSVYVDSEGERQLVNFRDTSLPDEIDPGDYSNLKIQAVLADTRWPGGARRGMEIARELGVPGILDAEDRAFEAEDAVALASHVAFSEGGMKSWAKINGSSGGEIDVDYFLETFSHQYQNWVCVTQGSHGVRWYDGQAVSHINGIVVDVVDTLGAGDIWHGAFALALAEGQEIEEAIRFSNAAAAIKCTRFGGRSGAPERQEVAKVLQQQS